MNTGISKMAPDDMTHLLATMQQSFQVRDRRDLLLWLQGDLQRHVPHDVMFVADGDFERREFAVNVISTPAAASPVSPGDSACRALAARLHQRWTSFRHAPFAFSVSALTAQEPQDREVLRASELGSMRSALVHGLRDARSGHDCLYVSLSADAATASDAHRRFAMLLPFINAAVEALGRNAPAGPRRDQPAVNEPDAGENEASALLSAREAEIMRWVRAGKTNHEIGLILDISAFTVKNHLQRIFKKIDVINRAQAVAQLDRRR